MQIATAIDSSTVAFLQTGYPTNRFVASAGANWAGVSAGNWMSIVGSPNIPYDISAVYPPGTGGNQTVDRWELTIVGVIGESASAAAAYVIGIDFLSSGLWDPQLRDTQTLQLLKRSLRIIDAFIGRAWDIVAKVIGADFATASTSLVDITGLSAALKANSVYEFEVMLLILTSADTNGEKFGIQFSASGALVVAVWESFAGGTTETGGGINALNTPSSVVNITASALAVFKCKGFLITGTNAGIMTVQALKVTSGTTTVKIGSILKIKKI